MAKLTAAQVKAATYDSKPIKLSDGGGLYLYIGAQAKSWRYDYRLKKQRKTVTFGTFPEIGLSKAREMHMDARRKVVIGIDPAAEKQAQKASTETIIKNSFETLAWQWFHTQKNKWTEGHARTVESRLKQNALPCLGQRPVDEILPLDVLEMLRIIEKRGAHETASRVKSICSQIFRFCVVLGLREADPCRDLNNVLTPHRPKHMAAITNPKKVGQLMRAIATYEGNNITKCGLELAPLVFVRPGEMRHAEWSEINFEEKIWKIPAEKMKMRTTHIVPLAKQAISILQELHKFTGKGRYLFPSMRSQDRPMSDNTLLGALRRLGFGNTEMTVHGFRGMASTLLHEKGWNTQIIERQLAHTDRDTVRAAYNHAEYLKERKEMMQFWANYLDELRETK